MVASMLKRALLGPLGALTLCSLALTSAPPALADGPPSATAGPPAAASARPTLPFTSYTLDNGLRVILHVDRRTPVVAVNVWYHVGSKDEPDGKNGFAHLFEHLMFQGSRNVGEDMFFKYLERAGVSDRNGTTNVDRTNYFETLPATQLPIALWLESDRMGFLLDHVDQKTLDSQRDVVKNERRQNYENAPYGMVYKTIVESVFPPGHPYHWVTIGTPEDLDRASLDDVRNFFRSYYVPNNASLVIAGDFDEAQTKALVSQYFGSLPRGAAPPTKTALAPVVLASAQRLEMEADVELPRLSIAWPSPPLFAPGDAELDVVGNVLTGGKSSRLYKRLVYDLEIAQDVSASQISQRLASLFVITVTLKPGKSLDEARALVDEELDKLRNEGPTEAEVSRTRTTILSDLVFRAESVTARANTLNSYLYFTGDAGYLDRDVGRYEVVSVAAVKNAINTFLPKDKRVIAFVRPQKGAPRAGRLVGGR